MPAIVFMQYRKADIDSLEGVCLTVPCSHRALNKANQIHAAGFRFKCEILTTGEVSLTITDDEADHAIEVVPNGPGTGEAVDRLVLGFEVSR